MITEIEKTIYNKYLKTLRSSQNKPYTLRKDFKDFENNPNYPKIKKIANMYRSCPHIILDDYFLAPYKVYDQDEAIYTLDFYGSMKALGCYKNYMKIKEMCDPDEEHQLDFIKQSLSFILKFCLEKNISFDEYPTYQTGLTYNWMKHYAEAKISLLCLLEFDYIYDIIMGMEKEHRSLLLGDLENRFYKIKGRYLESKRARLIVKKGKEILMKQTRQNKQDKENK